MHLTKMWHVILTELYNRMHGTNTSQNPRQLVFLMSVSHSFTAYWITLSTPSSLKQTTTRSSDLDSKVKQAKSKDEEVFTHVYSTISSALVQSSSAGPDQSGCLQTFPRKPEIIYVTLIAVKLKQLILFRKFVAVLKLSTQTTQINWLWLHEYSISYFI